MGNRIVFSSNRSGQSQLYLGELSSEAPLESNQFTFDSESKLGAKFTPDGNSLLYASDYQGDENFDLFLVNIKEGKPRNLTENTEFAILPRASLSHDGRRITFVSNQSGAFAVYVLKVEDGSINRISHHEFSDYYATFSPDDSKFAFDDRAMVFLFTGPKNPADLWKYDFESKTFSQLTNSLPSEIDTSNFVEGKQIYYECKKDGLEVPALIFTTIGKEPGKKSKAVIDIHGGPSAQDLNTWDPMKQVLISKGVVILSPNYRGSTGYGRKFRESNRFAMGDLDLADCASAWDYLVEQGIADPGKIAVTGGSFGGYLTMCALTKYPERWVCGSALVPFLNWFTEIKNEREDLRYWDLQNMGDPEKDKERLREASPIFYLDRVKVPVQVIAGAHDPRCPIEESEQARDELMKLGKQVEFKFYEDEGHGFRKIQNRIDAYRRSLSFLEKYLFG